MEPIIHDGNYQEFISLVEGGQYRTGLIPRDYERYPVGCYASAVSHEAVDFPLIPQSEWAERIADAEANKSNLSDILIEKDIPCLNQGPIGYCWAHSSTGCVQAIRATMNLPTVPLSAYAVAATIKQGRDEGGWGAQSLDFITSRGVPSQDLWPQGDRDYRRHDKPEVWANAAMHKVTEGWVDLQAAQYDRNLSDAQICSLLLARIPVVGDLNWWSHSIFFCDLVNGATKRASTRVDSGKLATLAEFELIWGMNDPVTAGFGKRFRNSWGKEWGDSGFGTLTGSKAIADGAVAPRVTMASAT